MTDSFYEKFRVATEPWEGRLWYVGGMVRDELLGRGVPEDVDVVCEGDVIPIAEALFERGISTIPPVTYPRFGTAMVRIDEVRVEFASARKESYHDDSRKPDVQPATLFDDAMRRDFTVNALMRNVHSRELFDPLGGLADLEAKVLRTPGDPAATFIDDPLRMLRAVRFRWQLGFTPVPGLYESIVAERGRLQIISGERIREELQKMLKLSDADCALDDLQKLGLTAIFAPEFDQMKHIEQGNFHHLDVWDHTKLVVKNAGPADPVLALGALFHDIGKPATRFVDEKGNTRFFNHENVGAEITRVVMSRLKFSNDEIASVVKLVRNHMRLGSFEKITSVAARRLIRDLGDDLDRLLDLVEADAGALKPGVRVLDLKPIRQKIREIRKITPKESLESPLSGQEIMELLRVPEGKQIGEAKHFLVEEVLEGRLNPGDKAAARQMLLHWSAAHLK